MKYEFRNFYVIKKILPLTVLILFIGCHSGGGSSKEAVISTSKGNYQFTLEVADTPSARAQGLMYRKSLGKEAAMLFIFSKNTSTSFWMKNTLISLDIIFMDENLSIIHIAQNTEPFSEELISAPQPYRYVLEVNSGFAAKSGAKVGDKVVLNL